MHSNQGLAPVIQFPVTGVLTAEPAADYMLMKPQDVTTDVLLEKYAKGGETTVSAIRRRVAAALAGNESNDRNGWESKFFHAQEQMGVVMAGRVNSAAGTGIKATLINCFVQPCGDSCSETKDGRVGIYTALQEAAETMRRGGGVGYNFSAIRPKGAKVKGTMSRSSGPLSFMKVFDQSCETVESAGARRGAQMGILNVNHPDIQIFVGAKTRGDYKNFNLSVGVSDAFMHAVDDDALWPLVHKAEPDPIEFPGAVQRADGLWVYHTLSARDLWNQIMVSTYNGAEPGIIFLDTVNLENNLYYTEVIEASNPCGEQMLPAYGCCCLGSINLTALVRDPFTDSARFDFDALANATAVLIRMLDNVLDRTTWPLPEQLAEAMNKRRVGAGFLGLGDALIMLGLPYDAQPARDMATRIAQAMRDAAYLASVELAKEKGAFPLFDAEKYLESRFIKRLPEHIRQAIKTHGIRNSHLLSIAPTGTIALAFADNASNGIEPAFSWFYDRKKRMPDGSKKTYTVEDHAYRVFKAMGGDVSNLPPAFVSAQDMAAMDHLLMVQAVAPYIDSAISKTINVPESYPFADFEGLYMAAWKAGLKGITTYRPNLITGSVLSVPSTAAPTAEPPVNAETTPVVLVDDNPLKKQFDKRPEGPLEGLTSKVVFYTNEGKKTVYITINFLRIDGVVEGKAVEIERPFEFFIPAGQRSGDQQWITSEMRTLSHVARSGGSIANLLQDLRQVAWDKGPVRYGFVEKSNGQKAPRFHDSEVAAVMFAFQQILINRGFLDADGNQVPPRVLATRLKQRDHAQAFAEHHGETGDLETKSAVAEVVRTPGAGKKCAECGAYESHKRDGCEHCDNCGAIGACS